MSQLFQPLRLGSLVLPNRIIIAPMCQYSADEGRATDWHVIHLGSLALSGAGLLITEATAVSPEGRITPGDLGLYSDETEAAFGRVLTAIRAYSPMPVAMQLAHAGRKASSRVPWEGGSQIASTDPEGWVTVAPSALPHGSGEEAPKALNRAGLDRITADFVDAARRAARLGVDGLEIHGAHGYLLHEFLSPLANRRTDDYGGSLENRMRFPLDVFEAVRAALPAEKPVWIRLSATDWVDGGWDIEGAVALSKALERRGCAAIHVSSGGVSPSQKIPLGPGYQVSFASRLGRWRVGHRGSGRALEGSGTPRLRRHPRLFGRCVAVAEDPARPWLPGELRQPHQASGRHPGDRGWPDHRARAGRSDRGEPRGRCGFAGPRHALRPSLALACRGRAR